MTWESTGEVRPPEDGEYYINKYAMSDELPFMMAQAIGPSNGRGARVIMRPVQEPKEPKEFHVVIPFNLKLAAEWFLEDLTATRGYTGKVEAIYE